MTMPTKSGEFRWAVVVIRWPWPPRALSTLLRFASGDRELELLACPDGRLGLWHRNENGSQLHMFQTVLFSGEGVSTIGFGVGETGEPVLLVRGVRLLLDPTGDA